MHRFSTDYRKRDGKRRGTLLDRGYFIHDLPRLIPVCRLFGHRPVVDGTQGVGSSKPSRWVCCDRCGVRADPQGRLSPAISDIGDRYCGPFDGAIDTANEIRNPGPWPTRPAGAVGAQLIIGKTFGGWNVEVKVGNRGSEQTLAAHVSLNPFGALYVHTEDFGTWLQRRLNPVGYESRVIRLGIESGGIEWKLWAKRNESSRDDPWWMRGRINLDPRDRLLGRLRYAYEDIGEPLTVTVRMPHGDDHETTLQLQQCTYGRNRRRFHSWTADWTTRPGIPTKPHGGEVQGSAVEVTAASVEGGSWPAEAAAGIAAQMTKDRTRYGYRPHIPVVDDDFDVEVDES